MPLVADEMKAKFKTRIFAGLSREFASDTDSRVTAQWQKIADAISDIAIDIVMELQTNAEVAPGQSVSTSGGPGQTTSPGQIK
jgi:hypothetical protein